MAPMSVSTRIATGLAPADLFCCFLPVMTSSLALMSMLPRTPGRAAYSPNGTGPTGGSLARSFEGRRGCGPGRRVRVERRGGLVRDVFDQLHDGRRRQHSRDDG